MIFQVLLAVILGKHKKYHVGKALTRVSFYPFYLVEIIYIAMQICVFFKNYDCIRYAPVLKSAILYTLLIPIFVYKLYIPALAGSGLIVVGTVLNKIVISANGGKMPVYPTLSKLTGYFSEEMLKNSPIHTLGGSATRFKILSDYIDIGYSVLSIGDLLIHFFAFIVFYYTMKSIARSHYGGILN